MLDRETLDARELFTLHELLCFWRAYPDDASLLGQLERRPHIDPIFLADGKSLPDLITTTSPGQQGALLPSGERVSSSASRARA